jgi:hypothetical protein
MSTAAPRPGELTGKAVNKTMESETVESDLEPDMPRPHPFRRALEAEDVEAMVATLSPD